MSKSGLLVRQFSILSLFLYLNLFGCARHEPQLEGQWLAKMTATGVSTPGINQTTGKWFQYDAVKHTMSAEMELTLGGDHTFKLQPAYGSGTWRPSPDGVILTPVSDYLTLELFNGAKDPSKPGEILLTYSAPSRSLVWACGPHNRGKKMKLNFMKQ